MAICLVASGCATPRGPSRLGFEGGERWLDSSWDGLDTQTTAGLTLTDESRGGFFGLDAGFYWAGASGSFGTRSVSLDSFELYGGIMKSVDLLQKRLRIDFGSGTSSNYFYASDRNAGSGPSSSDAFNLSLYGRASVSLRLGQHFWLGIGGRISRGGDVRIFGTDLSGDYEQVTLSLSLGR